MRTKLRSKFTLFFIVCAALLAVGGTAMALVTDTSGNTAPAPTIQSDKDDYRPGETVTLTGSNWQPGESVHINVNDDEGQTWSRDVDVTADANGGVQDQFQLPTSFVAVYKVTATGAQSGVATTSFTDGNVGIRNASTSPSNLVASYKLEAFGTNQAPNTDCSGTAQLTRTFSITGGATQTVSATGTNPSTNTAVATGNNNSVRVTLTGVTPTTQAFKEWHFVDQNASGDGAFFDTDGNTGTNDTQTSFCLGTQNSTVRDFIGVFQLANRAPTDVALSPSSVAENQPSGTEVGTLSSTDPDSSDTHTYSLVSGTGDADNSSFSIVGNKLKTNASFDFEADNSYSIRVRTTDAGGLTFEKQFTINVTNVNEAPTNVALSNNSVAENQPSGTAVGNFSSTDPDSSDTHTYTLVAGTGSDDNSSFTIDSSGTLKTAASFNFENKSSYSIRVRTTDAGNANFEKSFTITVTNVNEAPVLDLNGSGDGVDSSATFTEDGGAVGIVGALTVTDVDDTNMESAKATLTNNPDGNVETLSVNTSGTSITAQSYNATTGVLSLSGSASKADYEQVLRTVTYNNTSQNPSTADRIVKFVVNDGGLDSADPNSTVAVIAVNDAPEAANDSVTTAEDTSKPITLSATDVDSSGLTYKITALPAHGKLYDGATEITSANTTLNSNQVTYTPDANFNGPDSFKFVANDSALDSTEATVSITVTPVNDAPTVKTAAADDKGKNEGANLSTQGEFADTADNDALTITKTAGLGTVVDNHNGTWSWSLQTTDNVSGTVEVTASDGHGGTIKDSFDYSTINVAPTITGIAVSPLQALIGQPVSFTGTATDPGSADTTLPASLSWQWSKDGGAYAAGANPFSTTFATCGSHSVSAKATDKDAGTSAAFTASTSVQVYGGNWLPPLQVGKDNMVQKGQVVPVKISVAGCDGLNLAGLNPEIRLAKGDPTTGINELDVVVPTSVSAADTTGFMRPVSDGYIYNLRIPSDTTVKANDMYTIRVSPFGIATGQHMVIGVQIRK
jgi:hypothetical protein